MKIRKTNGTLSMGQKSKFPAIALSAVAMASLMLGSANAALVITLTEALDGGFTITGVGSGFMASAEQDGDWDIKDFNSNYLVGSASNVGTDSVTGTMQNLTLGTSTFIDEIELDEDGHGTGGDADDISIETTGGDKELLFNAGDEYSINFSGTYLASTFLYSNLVEGSHTHPGGSGNFFGGTTINVVPIQIPEPSPTWDGGGTGDLWSTPDNWDGNTVPVVADGKVTISGAHSVSLETAAQPDIEKLQIDGGADLTISSSLTVATDRIRIGGTGAGTLYLTDGDLDVAVKIYIGGSSAGGVGIFEISGGSTDSKYIENGTGTSHGTLRIIGDAATIDMQDFRQNNGSTGGTLELLFMDGGNGGGISTINVREDSKANGILAVDLSAYTLPSIATDYDVIVADKLRDDEFDTVTIDGVDIDDAANDDWSIAYVDEKIVRLTYAPPVSTADPEIASISVAGALATIDMAGSDSVATYTCDSSPDLVTWTLDVATTPATLTTVAGVLTFTVDASEGKKFYRIAE